jgi:hypothetical protein
MVTDKTKDQISIGIRFPDNDFYFAINAFLEGVQKRYTHSLDGKWHDDKEKNREHVVEMFNETIVSFFLLYQNFDTHAYRVKSLKEYLKIKKEYVFIGDEINEYISKCDGWDNSEFHYFFGVTGQVNTI